MAQRVIEEYRKFLFLAMRAGHQVIPPGIVNDVWMSHMQNAQNYWENLGKMITERPVAGGMDAKTMGNVGDAWAATLEILRDDLRHQAADGHLGQGPGARESLGAGDARPCGRCSGWNRPDGPSYHMLALARPGHSAS